MTFLKLTKNKTRLFLLMILSTFVVGVLFLLINRFLVVNYYLEGQALYCQLIYFFIGILQYIVIAYLTISFYKKKLLPRGEYYTIFKVAILLATFSFLLQLFLSYISQQLPETFLSGWGNWWFVIINLVWYYLLACIIYDFDEIRS